jgi:outer membrane lipoprotein SlyB
VAGAVAGHAIERKITAEEGLEIIVRLDRDDTIAVVQAADVEFAPGERVRVLFGHFGEARVTPL